MKFSVLASNLHKALVLCDKVVNPRPYLEVLANVRLETDGQRLKVSATNLSQGLTLWVGGKVDEEGITTVNFKRLLKFISTLKDDAMERLDFTLAQNDRMVNQLAIEKVGFQVNLNTISEVEWPRIPTVPENSVEIDVEKWLQAIEAVQDHMAHDDSRPVLHGICIELHLDKTVIVATDGYKFMYSEFEAVNPVEKTINIPAESIKTIIALLKSQTHKVAKTTYTDPAWYALSETTGQFFMLGRHWEYVTTLNEGRFPDFRAVIPEQAPVEITFWRADMLRALKQAGILAINSANAIKLIMTPAAMGLGRMEIIAKDTGDTISLKLDIDMIGKEPLEFNVNYKYLEECLAIKEDQYIMYLVNATTPAKIRPKITEGIYGLVMPMSIGR